MAFSSPKRTRSERVAGLILPSGTFAKWRRWLFQGDTFLRVLGTALFAIVLTAVAHPWRPAVPYRAGYLPSQPIIARVDFPNTAATEESRSKARAQVRAVFVQDPSGIENLKTQLIARLEALARDPMSPVWAEFGTEGAPVSSASDLPPEFQQLVASFADPQTAENTKLALTAGFADWELHGLLSPRDVPTASQTGQESIVVYRQGQPNQRHIVHLAEVLTSPAGARGPLDTLQTQLGLQLQAKAAAQHLIAWIRRQTLPSTLVYDASATESAQAFAAANVVEQSYTTGQTLALAGVPLSPDALRVLTLEHAHYLQLQPWQGALARTGAFALLAISTIGLGGYFVSRKQRGWSEHMGRYFGLLTLVIGAIAVAALVSGDPWRAELVPLLICAITLALALGREVALPLALGMATLAAVVIHPSLSSLLVYAGVCGVAIAQLDRVRTRKKLVIVGLQAALIAFALRAVGEILDGQPLSLELAKAAFRDAGWALAAGFFATGLLPFVERAFSVVTDISLLELGDVSHPLLQELMRRAPGTYNHSINVAAMAEVAAEAIGARGLLVRVGAYFHDIGKISMADYFVENQRDHASRHDSLVPAMSTLVIIAHVKDGAKLARQGHLPQPLVDFIEQHHGTTVVEFFFNRASRQSELDPDGDEVHESSFRYPGPKPQSKEAGVLMIADAVEGACRVLDEPGPACIEALVHDITMKRLLDGQFDESGLTLPELRAIETSLVKSLTAVYHSRVKYPEQRSA